MARIDIDHTRRAKGSPHPQALRLSGWRALDELLFKIPLSARAEIAIVMVELHTLYSLFR